MLYSATCQEFLCHIWQWQSLIVGTIAVLAAIATIWHMRKQITQIEKARAEDFERKKKAYRARMNPILSNLCHYNIDCFEALISEDELRPIPLEPVDEVKLIGEAIEYADEESSEAMAQMISQYQIHRSRLREFLAEKEYKPRADWSAEMVYNATLLHFQITNMFDYARSKEESIPTTKPSREQMMNALRNMMGLEAYLAHEQRVAGGRELIEKRHTE